METRGRPKNIDILYKQAQTDFTAYNLCVHNIGSTARWKASPFHHLLCQRVQRFIERESDAPYDILVINTPPQHGKSMTVTETLPSWYLGKYPENWVLEVSYNTEFAQRFGKRNKEKVEQFGGDIFGIELSKSTRGAEEWELSNNVGGMKSCGFNGGITGRKGNLIIIDDPVKSASEARSESYRNKIRNSWYQDIRTRTHPGSKIIVIMTRWHEEDLAGIMIDEETRIEVLNLPCECEEENDPLRRQIGDALCPEMGKDNKWLAEFKESYVSGQGIGAWYAMFQGRPVTEGGNIIKASWWKYYTLTQEFIDRCDELVMSVDAAFKDTGDPVAITVWGKKGADMYLIDLVNDRLDFTSTVKAIKGLKVIYPKIRQILIEDKANGSAIVSTLRSEIVGVIPIEPLGGKVARVNNVAYVIESGNVYLPDNKFFVKEFVMQCSAFPNGKHDDMVDSMSQALSRMVKHRHNEPKKVTPNIMDFFQKKPKTGDRVGKGEKVNVI